MTRGNALIGRCAQEACLARTLPVGEPAKAAFRGVGTTWSKPCFVGVVLLPSRVRRLLSAAAWLAVCLVASSAQARATDPVFDTRPDPRTIGTAVGSLVLDVPMLSPDDAHPRYVPGVGFSFQIVGGRERWPFMFGLGGGILLFDGSSQSGSLTGYQGADASFTFATTEHVTTSEIRHAELVVRFQPYWGVVRPFLELSAGLGVLWHGDRLENSATGETIANHDQQRSAGVLFGAALGLDFRLHTAHPVTQTNNIVLSVALRRWYNGPMERPELSAEASARSLLAMWVPFVGVAITMDNRPGHRKR